MHVPTAVPMNAEPIADETREQILAAFLAAVETALREVAMTEGVVHATYRVAAPRHRGELVAMLELSSAAQTCLAVELSGTTAAALAQRVLADTFPNPDAALIRDCLGELINVSAGQAKALLHGTPWQFTFGTPRVDSGAESPIVSPQEGLVGVMATDVGEVIVQVFLKDPARKS